MSHDSPGSSGIQPEDLQYLHEKSQTMYRIIAVDSQSVQGAPVKKSLGTTSTAGDGAAMAAMVKRGMTLGKARLGAPELVLNMWMNK